MPACKCLTSTIGRHSAELVVEDRLAEHIEAWLDEWGTRVAWLMFVRCASVARRPSQTALAGSTIWAWPSFGSVDFASTIGMIGRIRRPMSTTKCVCAATRTEKEGVLHRALVKQVGVDWRVAAAELGAGSARKV
jgi:hypothetical protein